MSGKTRLSKSILDMKFMKRTKEEVLKEMDAVEGRNLYSSEITEKMIHGTNYIKETSYAVCEDLIVGRFSCGGMNPDLERILEKEEQAANNKEFDIKRKLDAEMVKDVKDDEMAKHYSNLVKTISNKFNSKAKKRRNRAEDYSTAGRGRAKITKFE